MFTSQLKYIVIAVVFSLTACSSVSVTTDFDHSVAFSQYHSYTLISDQMTMSPSSNNALKETLRSQLAQQGIRETDEKADLHIVSRVSTQEKLQVHQSSDMGYGYRYGRYRGWGGVPNNYTDVSQYTEGTLILDFVDAKTQQLVFRGVGNATVDDPQTNAAHIKEIVQKIMTDFPVNGGH